MVLSVADIVAMARQRKNFDDLMLELSGISGRTPQFLTQEQIEHIREEAGRVSHETIAEKAWRQYLEFCGQVQRQLYAVNRAIEKALVKSERRVQAAQEALDDIRRRAMVDEKGRRVYRTADGTKAFTDDGQQLTSEEMASIQWDPLAPTWEQRVQAEERLKQAEEDHDEILRARERADYYSDRMASGEILSRTNSDDPPGPERHARSCAGGNAGKDPRRHESSPVGGVCPVGGGSGGHQAGMRFRTPFPLELSCRKSTLRKVDK